MSAVIGLEPSRKLLSMARGQINPATRVTEFVEASAEAIPLDDHSVDTAVTTWTLCSIPDVNHAFHEVRRVLKRDGRLLFVEHGRSPDAQVRRWQDGLNPIWKRIAGGCHLDRSMSTLIEQAGFRIEHLATGYGKGLKPMAFMCEGVARPD